MRLISFRIGLAVPLRFAPLVPKYERLSDVAIPAEAWALRSFISPPPSSGECPTNGDVKALEPCIADLIDRYSLEVDVPVEVAGFFKNFQSQTPGPNGGVTHRAQWEALTQEFYLPSRRRNALLTYKPLGFRLVKSEAQAKEKLATKMGMMSSSPDGPAGAVGGDNSEAFDHSEASLRDICGLRVFQLESTDGEGRVDEFLGDVHTVGDVVYVKFISPIDPTDLSARGDQRSLYVNIKKTCPFQGAQMLFVAPLAAAEGPQKLLSTDPDQAADAGDAATSAPLTSSSDDEVRSQSAPVAYETAGPDYQESEDFPWD